MVIPTNLRDWPFRLSVLLVFFFLSACAHATRVGSEIHGDKMEVSMNSDEQVIVVNDYGAKTQKIKPATDFPESMRALDSKVFINGAEKIIKVRVEQIQIRPLDSSGNLVEMKDAKIVSIQYMDGAGNVLQSTTMRRD